MAPRFTASLRRDFAAELSGVDDADLTRRVERLLARFHALDFHAGEHLYRLVAWGLFLGEDFLETHGLDQVARADAPEDERFKAIRTRLKERRPPL